MKKRISISDIAKALGISITTVSFILNGKAKERRISDALNRRVLDYVKKVGYKPSQLVRKSAGRTKVLALLLESIADPFFSEVGKCIERIAAASGYQVVYFDTANDANKMRQYIHLCIEKEVDGVIVVPPEDVEEMIGKMKQDIPMVLLDRFLPAIEANYVVSDNRKGAYDATKYLLEQESKRVGLVSLYSNQTHIRERLDGYMDAMDEFRMQSFIRKLSAESPEQEIAKQMTEFVLDNKLDAVLFATQYLAVGAMKSIQERGPAAPRIVTFDDHILFEHALPGVSVVVQDAEQVAQRAAEVVIAEIERKPKEAAKVVIPCQLKVRGSLIS